MTDKKSMTLKDEVRQMFNCVSDDSNVTYINIMTKTLGGLKCSNKSSVELKFLELIDGDTKELAYSYTLTNKELAEVNREFKNANAINMNGTNQVFKVLYHEFYLGEAVMHIPKTSITFMETFMIIENAESMEGKHRHIILRYDDVEGIITV